MNATAPPEEYMCHLDESTTYLYVQELFLGPGEYNTRFDDTNTLGVDEENVGFESCESMARERQIAVGNLATFEPIAQG